MHHTRRQMLRNMGLATIGAGLGARSTAAAVPGAPEGHAPTGDAAGREGTVATLYKNALVWDDHSGFEPTPTFDLEQLEEWRKAGVDYLSINVGYDRLNWQMAVRNLGSYITWLEKRPERFTLVRHADDVVHAKRAGKMAITFDLEGMGALNGDAYLVSLYYRLGVHQMLVAYNRNNLAGGGCHDDDHGLTEFGRQVIAEMNRVGMMVDCSHTGYRTTMEVMEMAKQPVIFSHSNPKALRAHGRNITDDQIRACARTGGVIGINGQGLFLQDRNATTNTMVDCIEYVRNLVGPDHVGIGLDSSPASEEEDAALTQSPEWWPPAEYDQQGPARDAKPEQLPEIAQMLLGRGWSPGDIKKILGGNFLRVARAVWK